MAIRSLKIAVCGLTGAGKSTILNAIVGKEVFTEGHHLHHQTLKVSSHTWSDDDNNFEVTVYDTPGFEDDSGDAEKYKADIRKNCADVDLLLYCISVEEFQAMLNRDKKTLKELHQVFDETVWSHCVIVLTFANAIVLRSQAKYKSKMNAKARVKKEYGDTIEYWKRQTKTALDEIGISEDIPIIPASNATNYSILDNNEYWLSQLFREVLEKMEDEKSDVLIMLNSHRFRSVSAVKNSEFLDVKITEQPLVIHKDFNKLKKRLKELGAAVGAGSISGAVGATIGAVIGTFLIGIPTFGVAAGAGLALGAVIGGAVGIGVGVSVYKIVNKFEEQKHTLKDSIVIRIDKGFI